MPENEMRVSCLLNEGYSVYSNVRVMRYSVSENEDAFDQYSYLHSTPRQTSPSPLRSPPSLDLPPVRASISG